MTFQKIPIPHLTRTMKQKFLHQHTNPFMLHWLFNTILVNSNFASLNFFAEPKVALSKELVYISQRGLSRSLKLEKIENVLTEKGFPLGGAKSACKDPSFAQSIVIFAN